MGVRRSSLLIQSLNEVALYFGLETRNRACAPFTCVHFTANQTHQELVQSPWDMKISPKFREMEPELVKITMRVRPSRLLFQS